MPQHLSHLETSAPHEEVSDTAPLSSFRRAVSSAGDLCCTVTSSWQRLIAPFLYIFILTLELNRSSAARKPLVS